MSYLFDARSYVKSGYLTGSFVDTLTRHELVETLKNIQEEKFKDGFSFKRTDSSFRKDLRPNAYEYSDVFLKILAENNIPSLVRRTIGSDACLINIAVVDSIPPGYFTSWHSDNFEKPVHKLIFYPSFGQPKQKRLEILQGHIRPTSRYSRRLLDNEYVRTWEPVVFKRKIASVFSSDSAFVYLNTQVLHRAFEVSDACGALRLLFSFRTRFLNSQEKRTYLELSDTTIEDIDALMAKFDRIGC